MKIFRETVAKDLHRTVSDPVDLHHGLVAGAAAAADDEGPHHHDCCRGDGEECLVLDGFFRLVDGVDELAGLGLDIGSTDCQLRSSKR